MLTKEDDIIHWLMQYKIAGFDIIENPLGQLVVNIDGSVELDQKQLTYIPVQFEYVSGYFDCSKNRLTSLKGSPRSVHNAFDCSENRLVSLEAAPVGVDGAFFCGNNLLVDLKGGPQVVGGIYEASGNRLESLIYLPQSVKSEVFLHRNPKLAELQKIQDLNVLKIHSEQQIFQHTIAFQKSGLIHKV